jgi:amino acid adenylation domain-containing protein
MPAEDKIRRIVSTQIKDQAMAVLSAEERRRLLVDWNGAEIEYPLSTYVYELFEAQTERTPEAVAVVFEDWQPSCRELNEQSTRPANHPLELGEQCVNEAHVAGAPDGVALQNEEESLTYQELNARANQLARYLIKGGIGPEKIVAVAIPPAIGLAVAILAIVKTGAAYLPLNTSDPTERMDFMLRDSAVSCVVTTSQIASKLPGSCKVLILDEANLRQALSRESGLNLSDVDRIRPLHPENSVYVIYTSGSTGSPKGVVVSHCALANYLWWSSTRYNTRKGIGAPLNTPLTFDATTTSFYLPLVSGKKLMLLPQNRQMERLAELLASGVELSLVKMTPTHLSMLATLLEARASAVRAQQFIVGGESLPVAIVNMWRQYLPHLSVVNEYGPTEAVVGCCVFEIPLDKSFFANVPIGRPSPNCRLYLLDQNLKLAAIGVAGELYIGGSQISRGYLNRPALTAQRFVADAYGDSGSRMYRTGDVARWLPDGTIEFLGRTDYQVKIRGFRIELGEIEARLAEHSGVREAVVVEREDARGEKHLVAYFTCAQTRSEEIDSRERVVACAQILRAQLSAQLPDYMVPAAYVRMEQMPVTENGKLDRKALPAPDENAYARREYEAPQGNNETTLARIWAELLEVERVGRQDNFFELGGHSLLAVLVISRVRRVLNLEVAINDFFTHPVLADLARGLENAARVGLPSITCTERNGPQPVSYAQRRLWFLAQMAGGGQAYHIPFDLRLKGDLNQLAMRRTLDRIVARHEGLRTTFAVVDGEPQERIASAEDTRFLLLEYDLRKHEDGQGELAGLIEQEAHSYFDLEHGPLIRGRLIRLAEEEHALLITVHHIVFDAWSMGVLLNELSALYSVFLRGEEDPLPALEVQYADYTAWQRKWVEGDTLREQVEYWKTTLAGAPAFLELPTDHERRAERDYAGAFVEMVLDTMLTTRLKELSQRHGATMFMTLLAAFAALLVRLSGQQDLVIGTPAANRGRAETEGLIGLFVNTLVLRLDATGSPTVGELLERVKAQAIAAQQHQDIPFEQIVEIVRPVRSLSHNPVFQVMFAWQNAPEDKLVLPGLEVESVEPSPYLAAKFDLTLALQEVGGRIVGGVEYATSLFERSTVERYLTYFRSLLAGMVADETQAVDRLPMLPEWERHLVLHEWNETAAEYPREKCVHELFEEQVERTPEAVAVVFEDATLTYAELNNRANQLGHYLRELGVKPDTRVAICVERGFEMVIGLLAILKAGGAYVPLDPGYPKERLHFILDDSSSALLLTQGHLQRLFIRGNVPVVDMGIKDVASAWRSQPETNPDGAGVGLTPEHLAYVIYTSGSTGQPKGVMVQHRGLCNQIAALRTQWRLSAKDRLLQFASVTFDVSVEEVFSALLSGAASVLRTNAWLTGTHEFWALCEKREVSVVDLPVRFWQQISLDRAEKIPSCVRLLVTGGEAVDRKALVSWFERDSHLPILFNAYGPTETTINATIHELAPDPTHWQSIGRPLANTRVYILDGHQQPVPVGVVGELYIGGAGVARGYLNRTELTAERFLLDPFVERPGARMYKTGDLGRWSMHGMIEFLGRNDFQVKIRGFRIELGEIEAALASHPALREAVVIAREDVPGEKFLVAYYTSPKTSRAGEGGGGEEALAGPETLRAHLSAKLPEYMVPAAYVRLEELPLTANGKLDRKALPMPEGDAYAVCEYAEPLGKLEMALAAMWAELLHLERVGRHDNFFELGGHSLLAMRVVSRIRQMLGLEVAISDLFAHPRLSDFSRNLESATLLRLPPITFAGRDQGLPLSFAQQRLWFLAQMENASEAYHIAFGPHLRGELNRTALGRSLDRIVARHEALSTSFVMIEGEPAQRVVAMENRRFHLVEHDLRQHDDPGKELDALIEQECRGAFDLRTGPLVRGRLIRQSEEEHTLLITMHHIVSDGWSMGVFGKELSALYDAFLRGQDDPLPKLAVQYADYAVWQRNWIKGDILRKQADYWEEALAGAPGLLEVPADHPRPARQDYAGAFTELVLDKELTAGLRELSRRHGTTLYMTLLAGWAVLLARLSGEKDLVIGTPVANRGQSEVESLIGFFVNTLALRLDVAGAPTVCELLARVKKRAVAAQQHQDIPFEQVVELARAVRSLTHSPLFQVMFAWQNAPDDRLVLPGLETRLLDLAAVYRVAKFDLTLFLQEAGEVIVGGLEYATALFEPATIERYLEYFRTLVAAMVADDGQVINHMSMLPERERHQLVYEWNQTEAEYPSEQCVHELFEAQARKTPESVAVVYEDTELSYAELNRRANQLAHYLRGLGVMPDARVAICVERSIEMIVALLAVLKAGGAYVPLDPAYPVERLRWMLEDSGATVLLTQEHLQGTLAGLSNTLSVVDLTSAAPAWKNERTTNPESAAIGLIPEQLAYVIYTSGSTGTPKGVAMPHRALVNLLWWQISRSNFEWRLRTLQFAALGFDVAFQETFSTLCSGGVLVLISEAQRRSPMEFVRFIGERHIQRVFLPYVGLQSLAQGLVSVIKDGRYIDCALREVIVAGEQLRIDCNIRRVFEHLVHCTLENQYGPTETHVVSSFSLSTDIKNWPILPPIGRPIANTRVYILGEDGEPVPLGVTGELYIGGEGVAREYLNRPELTAERFLEDPFVEEAGARMYRTGDLGRWSRDRAVEFLGRADFQVKIRGYRVELGEVEERLAEHDAVRDAVVVAREDALGEKRLVAYYTCARSEGRGEVGKENPGAEPLRAYLARKLPDYMVPAAYVPLQELPLTANGKLDRKALPAPGANAYAAPCYEAPVGETEALVAKIWAEVLSLNRVGRRDNFFDLGGHSLLAVRVVARLRQALGVEVTIVDLFAQPILSSLAEQITRVQLRQFDSKDLASIVRLMRGA